MRLPRIIPRFSLRTLVVFLLLVTSGVGLWWHWEAWYRCCSMEAGQGYVRSIEFGQDASQLIVEHGPLGDPTGSPVPTVQWTISKKVFDVSRCVQVSSSAPVDHVLSGEELAGFQEAPAVVSPNGLVTVIYHTTWALGLADVRTHEVLCVLGDAHGKTLVHPPCAFSEDGRTLAVATVLMQEHLEDAVIHVFRRRRPEWWWGVFWLWEFWLTAALAAIFVWSVVRDRRRLARTG